MELNTYFIDFLKWIRLTPSQVSDLETGHTTLRGRLEKDEKLSKLIVSTFLQGSYRRSTAIRPKGDNRSDVDIVVVTRFNMNDVTPDQAIKAFIPFMEEHYKGKYRVQGRSIGINLSYVDMDLVPTAAPSISEESLLKRFASFDLYGVEEFNDVGLMEKFASVDKNKYDIMKSFYSNAGNKESDWKTSPLYIPDREAKEWKPTHPLEQIRQTILKNNQCNGHYINVVKALKWWRRENNTNDEPPKSYPLEHLIWFTCNDGIKSVAEGVTVTLENIVARYPKKPYLPDHGVPQHDVMGRVTADEYNRFYKSVCEAAATARKALDSRDIKESIEGWKKLFGSKFPDPVEPKNDQETKGGYTERKEKSDDIGKGRFA